jgi:hypothetical protein
MKGYYDEQFDTLGMFSAVPDLPIDACHRDYLTADARMAGLGIIKAPLAS